MELPFDETSARNSRLIYAILTLTFMLLFITIFISMIFFNNEENIIMFGLLTFAGSWLMGYIAIKLYQEYYYAKTI